MATGPLLRALTRALCFLRKPSRPIIPSPVAKSHRLAESDLILRYGLLNVRFAPGSDQIADIAKGPSCANRDRSHIAMEIVPRRVSMGFARDARMMV